MSLAAGKRAPCRIPTRWRLWHFLPTATHWQRGTRTVRCGYGARHRPLRSRRNAGRRRPLTAPLFRLPSPDTGERRSQRALSADEQKLADACRLYLEALPGGPHAVETAFKVGRLEYVSSQLEAAEKHLSWIALNHPEHELAEYAANLVLDISNLRKDWQGVHRWALRFLEDKRLTAHGTLLNDLRRHLSPDHALVKGAHP